MGAAVGWAQARMGQVRSMNKAEFSPAQALLRREGWVEGSNLK